MESVWPGDRLFLCNPATLRIFSRSINKFKLASPALCTVAAGTVKSMQDSWSLSLPEPIPLNSLKVRWMVRILYFIFICSFCFAQWHSKHSKAA